MQCGDNAFCRLEHEGLLELFDWVALVGAEDFEGGGEV
jgi:hypothetical protein